MKNAGIDVTLLQLSFSRETIFSGGQHYGLKTRLSTEHIIEDYINEISSLQSDYIEKISAAHALLTDNLAAALEADKILGKKCQRAEPPTELKIGKFYFRVT